MILPYHSHTFLCSFESRMCNVRKVRAQRTKPGFVPSPRPFHDEIFVNELNNRRVEISLTASRASAPPKGPKRSMRCHASGTESSNDDVASTPPIGDRPDRPNCQGGTRSARCRTKRRHKSSLLRCT